MQIKESLQTSKNIWKNEKLSLGQIIVRIGKVYGDICRWERDAKKDKDLHADKELKK